MKSRQKLLTNNYEFLETEKIWIDYNALNKIRLSVKNDRPCNSNDNGHITKMALCSFVIKIINHDFERYIKFGIHTLSGLFKECLALF